MEHSNKKLLSFTKLMCRAFCFSLKTKHSLVLQLVADYKKTRKKEKTTDKVPGPSTSDNRQPTSNNQPEVPKPRISQSPQQVHLVTLCVERLVHGKKNEVRLGSFKQLTRELRKDFAA